MQDQADPVLDSVTYERDGRVAIITLNRPGRLNAMDEAMEGRLRQVLDEFDRDPEAWVAILRGEGRAFGAGVDVKARMVAKEGATEPREQRLHSVLAGPTNEGYLGRTVNWKPVIAAVHGHCIGLAFSLAIECDLIVAADDAKFSFPEVLRGFSGARVWSRLFSTMPSKTATEMMLTGRSASPAELAPLGLISRVVERDGLLAAARELADQIAALPPLAVRSGVRIARWAGRSTIETTDMYVQGLRLQVTEDCDEAIAAFMEKREPKYVGR